MEEKVSTVTISTSELECFIRACEVMGFKLIEVSTDYSNMEICRIKFVSRNAASIFWLGCEFEAIKRHERLMKKK